MNLMIARYGESSSNPNYLLSSSNTKKSDTINVTKAVARKYTLILITRVKAANSFH
jgi:hypothetical protein